MENNKLFTASILFAGILMSILVTLLILKHAAQDTQGWAVELGAPIENTALAKPSKDSSNDNNRNVVAEAVIQKFTLSKVKKPPEQHLGFYESASPVESPDQSVLNEIEAFYGLPPGVLYSQSLKESGGYCPSGPNSKGAVGCFQFLDATAREFSLLTDDVDYRSNYYASADAAARYLVWLMLAMFPDEYDFSDWDRVRFALAAYNAGIVRVSQASGPAIPRFYETMRYVHDIEMLTKGKAHWVNRGETLQGIASIYGVSVDALKSGNPGLSELSLMADTIIHLPDPLTGNAIYLVRPGDTLYAIQSRTGVSMEKIVSVNELLNPDLLSAWVPIHIPTGI